MVVISLVATRTLLLLIALSATRSALRDCIIDKPTGMGYKTYLILCHNCQETGSLSFEQQSEGAMRVWLKKLVAKYSTPRG